jgi:hypothetical protein
MIHRFATPLAAALAAVALAACRPQQQAAEPPSSSASPAVTASAAQSSAQASPVSPSAASATGRLQRFHDPDEVTYSITLHTCHTGDGGQIPDRSCTPGSVDPAVTQADIGSTICRSGYTTTVRPPESQTERAKFDIAYPAYGIPHDSTSELDHLVSLELGGSNDITNLWPEVGSLPNPKDSVENALHRAVCEHKVSLAAAQRAISSDWITAEARLGLS